jgi:peptidoglycan/xylan/chitin deacetylase (PgdA/CDA1 family)
LRTRFSPPPRVLAVAIAIAILTTMPLVGMANGRTGMITVSVQGRPYPVPSGTSLGELIAAADLRAPAGSLLDIHGDVLALDRYPGRILLNGSEWPASITLRPDDRIEVVSGSDQVEPLIRTSIPVAAGAARNPQFSLARVPGEQVVVSGAVSGKIKSASFQAGGSPTIPRAVALTFDDGPSPTYTRKVLSILRRFHASATFFVIGIRACQYPSLVRQEVGAGMAVGNHSWDHPNSPPFARLGAARISSEIRRAGQCLQSLGTTPAFFRPPGGSFSPEVISAAKDMGERVVLWDVDPRDWSPGRTWRQIVRNVLQEVHAGAIVDLHDGGGDRSATVKALPHIIRGIRARHLQLVAIGT